MKFSQHFKSFFKVLNFGVSFIRVILDLIVFFVSLDWIWMYFKHEEDQLSLLLNKVLHLF